MKIEQDDRLFAIAALLLAALCVIFYPEYLALLAQKLFLFLSGRAGEMKNSWLYGDDGYKILGIIITASIVLFAMNFCTTFILEIKIGKSYSSVNEKLVWRSYLYFLYVNAKWVVLEEAFARLFFLSTLPWLIRLASGYVTLYPLFFIGNGLWAVMHIKNYRDRKERNILRAIPHFAAGIILSAVFLAWGLLAAMAVHFMSNVIIMSIKKINSKLETIRGKNTCEA